MASPVTWRCRAVASARRGTCASRLLFEHMEHDHGAAPSPSHRCPARSLRSPWPAIPRACPQGAGHVVGVAQTVKADSLYHLQQAKQPPDAKSRCQGAAISASAAVSVSTDHFMHAYSVSAMRNDARSSRWRRGMGLRLALHAAPSVGRGLRPTSQTVLPMRMRGEPESRSSRRLGASSTVTLSSPVFPDRHPRGSGGPAGSGFPHSRE